MSDHDRLTKRERRERARAERRAAEAAAAKRARFERIRNIAVTIAVLAAVPAIFVFTQEDTPPPVELTAAEVDAAQQSAGCAPADVPVLGADHLDPSTAPPATSLYPVRPPSSGPHFVSPLAPTGFNDEPIEERSAVHNLEHGAVVVWYDPDQVDDPGAIERWVKERNAAGFSQGARGGAAVIAAPFPDGLASGKAVALRAWAAAVDCDRFEPTAADGFLATTFGTRGQAPEGGIAGFPEGAVTITGGATPGPTPTGSPAPSPTPSG